MSLVPKALLVASLACASVAASASGEIVQPTVNTGSALPHEYVSVHDPVMIREGNTYYVYSTTRGGHGPLVAWKSNDLAHWQRLPSPLANLPDWAREAVPDARGMWAPDITRVGGRYRLYYAVSRFGTRNSVIGLASSASLDPKSPHYGWRDDGPVLSSSDHDNFNAIDPNLVVDSNGRQWLAFGSFWSGLKIIELDPATGKPRSDASPISIAGRDAAHGHAIEAALVIAHGKYHYLIASFDNCCRGVKSTYKLAVGRSEAVTGPYVDEQGVPMLDGGGTIILQADKDSRFRGPGHAGYFKDRDGAELLVYHAYDADRRGQSTLRIAKIVWDAQGWPVLEDLHSYKRRD
ncbi:arabinan endo-1,5-alpha-L-arabinosidase [Tsuneonella mangrovi]|uniref:arabinan endo-1,5-alpha-L-arabinosidase n=1 Tax=Tsuneonella mangrovi TaxID=1982042 RepID=UPI001F0A95F8|nr:arabinan endo-1,5-alpha-L-arabinosidase [Tsuneonella mangrovi]